MKSLKSLILLLSTVFLICLTPAHSDASSCSEEEQKKALETVNKRAIKSMQELSQKLVTYKSIASQYKEMCNKDLKEGTQTMLSTKAMQDMSTLLGDDQTSYMTLTLQDNYKFTGVNWTGENPTNKKCKKLQSQASKLQSEIRSAKDSTETLLGLYRRDENVPASCYCDSSTENADCVAYNKGIEQEKSEERACELFTVYVNQLANCPLCPLFQVVLNADNNFAHIGWNAFAKSLQQIVLTFFLVFLAMNTLKIISAPSGANTGAYLKSVIGLGLKVAISYYLLSNSSDVYKLFISPVVKGGLDMGIAFLSIGNPAVNACLAQSSTFSNVVGGELDASLLGSIYNTIYCFGQSASLLPAVGRGLICYGWYNEGGTLPDFSMWIIGLLLYVFGVGIWLVIGLYLIDCTVQLGILCALVPFFIACWPFKITASYTGKGVQMLMNTFFNFALAGVMLVVGMKIVGYSASGKDGDILKYIKAIDRNNLNALKEMASLDGLQMLTLIACCIFAFKLIGVINDVADQFSRGSGSSIAPKIGGMAASTANAIKNKALASTGKIISAAGEASGITPKLKKAVNGTILGAASKVGAAMGLKKYQPGAQSGMPPQGSGGGGNTPPGGGGNTPPGGGGGNTPPGGGGGNTPPGGGGGNPPNNNGGGGGNPPNNNGGGNNPPNNNGGGNPPNNNGGGNPPNNNGGGNNPPNNNGGGGNPPNNNGGGNNPPNNNGGGNQNNNTPNGNTPNDSTTTAIVAPDGGILSLTKTSDGKKTFTKFRANGTLEYEATENSKTGVYTHTDFNQSGGLQHTSLTKNYMTSHKTYDSNGNLIAKSIGNTLGKRGILTIYNEDGSKTKCYTDWKGNKVTRDYHKDGSKTTTREDADGNKTVSKVDKDGKPIK